MLVKKKFRYICIYLSNVYNIDHDVLVKDFLQRYGGLYGSIDLCGSNIKIIPISDLSSEFMIIKCNLKSQSNVILALYFTNYPFIIISTSGSIKQLKKRINFLIMNSDLLLETANYKHNLNDI